MNDSQAVKSAARVLDLLELFSSASDPLGVSDVARRLNFPKSSAYMLLATLEQRGFLECDAARRFQLHPTFSADARAWIGSSRGRLMQIAGGPMRTLVDKLNETCLLTVLRPDWLSEYVAKVSSTRELRLDPPVGMVREPNAGSGGLVLLAYLSEDELERFFATHPLQSYTQHTICDPNALRTELAAIRSHGYAVTEGMNYPDASGLAAPVRNIHGKIVAAISIGAPTTRFRLIREEAITAVVKAGEALSRLLQA
jgi:DNA-binding IclR family transcriptional regulator